MLVYYLQIKWVHVAAVIASGSLFLLRGLLVSFGRERLAMLPSLRYLSYGIDTVLLTAALMLVTVLHQYPFVQAWLTVKVVLLLVYVVLGSMALKRAQGLRARRWYLVAALCVFGFMLSVARSHSPLGLFSLVVASGTG